MGTGLPCCLIDASVCYDDSGVMSAEDYTLRAPVINVAAFWANSSVKSGNAHL